MKTVECQTSLTWGFSERLLKTALSSVRTSGGPGSVSAGTQASSRRSRPASADARVPCDPAKCSETVKGSADPSKTASKGSAVPSKTGPKGSAGPLKTASKGSAGPLKTASSKDDSSTSRSSPTAVRVGRVLGDVEGFVQPRRSAPSGGTQAPPKSADSDRRSGIWSFRTSIQPCPMTRWTRHRSHLTEAMEHSIVQWNLRGFRANYEELVLLSKQYKPAVIALQETLLTNSKLPTFSGFNILNKNSLNSKALTINNSYLFSEVQLNTPLQAVAARVTLSKAVTVCNIYIPPSVDVSLSSAL